MDTIKKLTPKECGRLGGLKNRSGEWHAHLVKEYYKNPKKCKSCGAVIEYTKDRRNDFCSHSCAAKYNNRGVRRHGNEKSRCEICGKVLRDSKRKCCRKNPCKMLYTIKQYGDLSYQPEPNKRRIIKEYYIYLRGHMCEKCKTTTWLDQLIPLILHHINGRACDNSPDNVQLLCPNCHTFTPTFCGKNKGKSTRERRYYLI